MVFAEAYELVCLSMLVSDPVRIVTVGTVRNSFFLGGSGKYESASNKKI